MLVGSPNVGKSVVFGSLTGNYAIVSNCPGTTVEIAVGQARFPAGQSRTHGPADGSHGGEGCRSQPASVQEEHSREGEELRIVDTPGMYSLLPITEEERITRRLLFGERPHAVVHVLDAKSIERTLPLSLQLLELGLPVIVVLNMMDEAERTGIVIDWQGLAAELGVPVIPTVATTGKGLDELRRAAVEGLPQTAIVTTSAARLRRAERVAALHQFGGRPGDDAPRFPSSERRGGGVVLRRASAGSEGFPSSGGEPQNPVTYSAETEKAIGRITSLLPVRLASAARGIALLLLQRDEEVAALVRDEDPQSFAAIERVLQDFGRADSYSIAVCRFAASQAIAARHVRTPIDRRRRLADWIGDAAIRPITGVPLLLLVLYLGLYQLVGVLAAQDMVGFLEKRVFGQYVNPWFNGLLARLLADGSAWKYWARELLGGDYGIVTFGLTYAVAIVLPIVGVFFLFFSVLEDVGYFPRLAMLVDRVFRRIGLNGRAVIPLVLGLGCDTMATLVTRIQETERERLITTILLALAVPCSAQYGVVAGLLASQPAGPMGVPAAFLIWAFVVLAVFIVGGLVISRLIPGQPASFYLELPPLRAPSLANVLRKTMARLKWYSREVIPVFAIASVVIWLGRLLGIFDLLIRGLRPVVGFIGLPPEAAESFLYGFFRRDLGAAGLYRLSSAGGLSSAQLVVAAVTLTLFLPCFAQLTMMAKERGTKTALAIAGAVLATAFVVGALVNFSLAVVGFSP
ncbi:MAG: ferrous iron transport protein B [Pseudomonadota bacterium]